MRDLLFVSMVRWDTIWQRPQHIASGLSKYFRILYIDPVAYSILGALRNHLFENRSRNFKPILRKINSNLLVYTPPPMIPFSEDYWWINEIIHRFLKNTLSKFNLLNNLKDPILYINSPFQLPVLKWFPHSLVCYDCMDQYDAFHKINGRRSKIIIQKEKELLSQIQVAFATSENLLRHISTQNKNVYLVQNGVSDLFIDYSSRSHSTTPSDFPNGNGPVIGYIGAISNWFDINAIRILAESHPNWRFVIIGPVLIDVELINV